MICWTTRREADPRYDNHGDAFAPPACGHAACVGNVDAAVDCLISRIDALCVLDANHDGAHEFDGAPVVLEFAPLEAAS